jgi:tRNA threonylcarbamoyladenosine modification (KEOPS) complex Cgi121 subunit
MENESEFSSEINFATIEEHAQNENISASIFAAVKAMKNWNAGKKVHKDVFNEAIRTFLNEPIGGAKNGTT